MILSVCQLPSKILCDKLSICFRILSVTDFCHYTALLISSIIRVLRITNNYSSVSGVETRPAMVTPVACNLGKAAYFMPVGSR